jgi:hypothetical protein
VLKEGPPVEEKKSRKLRIIIIILILLLLFSLTCFTRTIIYRNFISTGDNNVSNTDNVISSIGDGDSSGTNSWIDDILGNLGISNDSNPETSNGNSLSTGISSGNNAGVNNSNGSNSGGSNSGGSNSGGDDTDDIIMGDVGGSGGTLAGGGLPAIIELSTKNPEYNAAFKITNMMPGDSETKLYCIKVKHNKNATIKFRAAIGERSEKLAEVIKCKVEIVGDDKVLYHGKMADMPEVIEYNVITDQQTETDLYYRVTAYLDTSVGNEYAEKSLAADFRWWTES